MKILEAGVCLALVVACVAWAPTVGRNPRARLTWMASAVGSVALFTRGAFVPYEAMDSFLGGTNVLKLFQVMLALVAFWLLGLAVLRDHQPSAPKALTVLNGTALLTMIVAFCSITDRAPSSPEFLAEYANQSATGIFAGSYSAAVMSTALTMALGLPSSGGKELAWIRAGALAVTGACAAELAVLALRWFEVAQAVQASLDGFFDATFYGGIMLIIVGMMIASARRRRYRKPLERACRVLEGATPVGQRHTNPRGLTEAALLERLYDICVALKNRTVAGSVTLTPAQEYELVWAQNQLLGGPSQ